MKRYPLIGIGPHYILSHENSPSIGSYKTYIDAIIAAKGEPVILTPYSKDIKTLAKKLDGILLQGGGDIHPRHFGAKMDKKIPLKLSPESRTKFDLAMLETFIPLRKPILGICLGSQTINVAMGGTIIQDIPTYCPDARNHDSGKHPTFLQTESKLYGFIKQERIITNTHHHQSMHKLGRGLIISAQCDDGIIEAVEAPKHPFLMGIQWHPERDKKSLATKRLFDGFIQNC